MVSSDSIVSKAIVFLLSSAEIPRTIKRIEEFVEHGYDVKVFAFYRKSKLSIIGHSFEIIKIGELSSQQSYYKRLCAMYKGVKEVHKRFSHNTVYYLFGLDVAIVAKMVGIRKYIYEEADMTHTYIRVGVIRSLLEKLDKRIIRKSLLTVFTSEGFAKYHFGNKVPNNVVFIPNRINKAVYKCEECSKNAIDIEHLKIGFVGGFRFKSIMNVATYICKNKPSIEFHLFGVIDDKYADEYKSISNFPNFYYHGSFITPTDLPRIYSQIDLVLSTYDIEFENVRYAEPNKIYEAIYFRTPIIVSSGTFLGDKVNRLGIGYIIDPLCDESIRDFIDGLTLNSINEKIGNLYKLDRTDAVNDNTPIFKRISTFF